MDMRIREVNRKIYWGLVLNEEAWMTFCKNYVEEALAPYKGDPNVLGFFPIMR